MLKVLAISAPHWPGSSIGDEDHLCSSTPFSLLNALRSAFKRLSDISSGWHQSNWVDSQSRQNTIYMSDYDTQTRRYLDEVLLEFKPNFVLIGSMTLSTIGAYNIAKHIRTVCGDRVFILFGGKHANETVYLKDGELTHHISSPLKLMRDKKIAPVFDAVASGDCENLIAELGEIIYHMDFDLFKKDRVIPLKYHDILSNATGRWVLAWLDKKSNEYDHLTGNGVVDHSQLPNIYDFYPINTNFKVLGGEFTAHTYSNSSKGCIYSCHFCSESAHINGKVGNLSKAVQNLSKSFDYISEKLPENSTAFVEDSIFLQGSPKAIKDFYNLRLGKKTINFGCQFTVDNILNPRLSQLISNLTKVGLNYIFMGLETGEESLAKRMSKNRKNRIETGNQPVTWMEKVKLMFDFCKNNNIKMGVSILFGLGESQESRVNLLNQLIAWQEEHSYPSVVSMNWAVKHPLISSEKSNQYEYFEWGISESNPTMHHLTRIFGEVSDRFHLDGVESMTYEETVEIVNLYNRLNNEL